MSRIAVFALGFALLLPACDKEPEMTAEELGAKVERRLAEADKKLLNNKADEAEQIYNWVLEQQPANAGALAGLGRVHMDTSDWAGAEPLLQKAVAADASNADAQAALATVMAAQKKWPEAEAAWKAASEIDPENGNFAMQRGICLRELNKLEESEAILRAASELDPELQFVFSELGDTLRAQNKLDEALKTYMKAQNTYASDKRARAGAGFVYEEQGKISLAVDEWSNYIRMDCCSYYSDDVAKPKLEELRKIEAAPDPEPPADEAG